MLPEREEIESVDREISIIPEELYSVLGYSPRDDGIPFLAECVFGDSMIKHGILKGELLLVGFGLPRAKNGIRILSPTAATRVIREYHPLYVWFSHI